VVPYHQRVRYLMRQKLLSWGDDFVIRDESGRDAYLVDGRVLCFGDTLSLKDMAGNELAFIAQRLLAWGPTYEITRAGRLVAVVRKKIFTVLRCQFTVDVPGPDDLVAEGDLLDHEYTFARHGEPVAWVSKRWFAWTDTYGIDVRDDEDDVLILASAVVIDLACHDHPKRH
jgi:uncharacterized protein YxjI